MRASLASIASEALREALVGIPKPTPSHEEAYSNPISPLVALLLGAPGSDAPSLFLANRDVSGNMAFSADAIFPNVFATFTFHPS